jgi:hypothetical protein
MVDLLRARDAHQAIAGCRALSSALSQILSLPP